MKGAGVRLAVAAVVLSLTSAACAASSSTTSQPLRSLLISDIPGFTPATTDGLSDVPVGSLTRDVASSSDCDGVSPSTLQSDAWQETELRSWRSSSTDLSMFIDLCVSRFASVTGSSRNYTQLSLSLSSSRNGGIIPKSLIVPGLEGATAVSLIIGRIDMSEVSYVEKRFVVTILTDLPPADSNPASTIVQLAIAQRERLSAEPGS